MDGDATYRPSAAARLLVDARRQQRPRWSQSFLAEELSRRGRSTNQRQIMRLEGSSPGRCDLGLLSAAALVLGIDHEDTVAAVAADMLTIQTSEAQRLSSDGSGPAEAPA